jgi:hypothetical protein
VIGTATKATTAETNQPALTNRTFLPKPLAISRRLPVDPAAALERAYRGGACQLALDE